MRTISTIRAEIVELSAVKSTYNHFLASYDAQVEVENATQVEANKGVVTESLRKLYVELEEAKVADNRWQITEVPNNKNQNPNEKQQAQSPPPHTPNLRMKFEPYIATELEDRAIMLFNSDRRYTITE